ncbi:MAG: GIY-YIG nuclease family protein [Candidatus Scalindua sp.]
MKRYTHLLIKYVDHPVLCVLTLALLNSFGLKVFYTYILQSVKDKEFYTGFTKNLKLRFEQHNKGIVESTKDRRPFKLIYYEACLSKDDSIRKEKYFMTYHGKMFLKRRLKSYLTG